MSFKDLGLVGLLLLGISACANNPFSSYKTTADKRLNQVYQGNLYQAIESTSTPDLLYHMEYGSILRLDDKYESSSLQLNLAYNSFQAWQDLWENTTQGQLSDSIIANLINDNANDYQAKDYEKVFISTYSALNYFNLKNYDYARVNVKRIGQTEQALKNYNQAIYAKAKVENSQNLQTKGGSYLTANLANSDSAQDFYSQVNSPAVLALANSYQNAYSNYIAGYIYEALNDQSNARAGYLNALELSPGNSLIQQSIKNLDANKKIAKGYSDVLIVEEAGHAPQIKSEEFSLPFNAKIFAGNNNNAPCINSINIFFPKIVVDHINGGEYGFSIDDSTYNGYLLADTNLMLARYLHDQSGHIIARNVAAGLRNIASSQAVCSAGGNLGAVLSLATTIGGVMLDRADERTWTMLPGKVYVNRLKLAYGSHVINVNVNGIAHRQTINIDQPATILSFRVLGNQVYFTN